MGFLLLRTPTTADVAARVWRSLQDRYPDDATDRRTLLETLVKRQVRKRRSADAIYHAINRGMTLRVTHELTLARQQQSRREAKRLVARARRDVARALASLRTLVPTLDVDDDVLWSLRAHLLGDVPPASKGGRPWSWKQETDAALKAAGVPTNDRTEILAAIGFVDE